MSDSQKLSIQVDSDHSMGDSIPSPPSNTWLAILPSQDLIPSNVIGTNLSIPVSQIYAKNQSQKFRDQNFSFDQVEIFANQTKEIFLHLQSTIKDHQTRENNLFIENQGLKDNISKIESQLFAEKIKYNKMVCEGKTIISSLSSDNIDTKDNLDSLKKINFEKESAISELTDQISNLSLKSINDKKDLSERSIRWKTRYHDDMVKWNTEKTSLLVTIENNNREIINVKKQYEISNRQVQDYQTEISSLNLQVKSLQESLCTAIRTSLKSQMKKK